MDMQFTITAQDLESPLQIVVSGCRIEFSGFTGGKKVAIAEALGKFTVSFTSVEDMKPVVEPELSEVMAEVQSEAAVAAVDAEVVPEKVESIPEAVPPAETSTKKQSVISDIPNYVLFQQLAGLRRQIASEVKLPAYIIFQDKTLQEMCRVLPADLEALAGISGVGASKLEKYGSRFVEVIRAYVCSGKSGT